MPKKPSQLGLIQCTFCGGFEGVCLCRFHRRCNILQHTATREASTPRANTMHISGRYGEGCSLSFLSLLQYTATHCNTLQHKRPPQLGLKRCTFRGGMERSGLCGFYHRCNMLQHAATYCNKGGLHNLRANEMHT